jgi:hypothetical protein
VSAGPIRGSARPDPAEARRRGVTVNGIGEYVPALFRQRAAAALAEAEFFPELISGPFRHGLIVVFALAAVLAALAALASALRGSRNGPARADPD